VLVAKGSERIYARGFGLRDLENHLPVDEDTLVCIASATKAFTAFSVGLLADDGLVAWDEPIKQYVPESETFDSYITQNATMVDLLSHCTGLPDGLLENPEYTRRGLFEKPKDLEPAQPFRATFLYSNLLYAIVGYIVGYLAGKSWEDVVTDRILTPLGTEHSDFSFLHRSGKADQSKVYAGSGRFPVPPGKESQAIDIGGPAGSINSSVRDMYPWLVVHLNGGKWNDIQIIEQDTLARICSPQMICGWPLSHKELSCARYGMGWVIEQYKGCNLVMIPLINGLSQLLVEGTSLSEMLAEEVAPFGSQTATGQFVDIYPLTVFQAALGHHDVNVAARNWREQAILLGECKWAVKAVGRSVIRALVGKAQRVVPGEGWRVHYAFFARAGSTDAARAEAEGVGAWLVDLERLVVDLRRAFGGTTPPAIRRPGPNRCGGVHQELGGLPDRRLRTAWHHPQDRFRGCRAADRYGHSL